MHTNRTLMVLFFTLMLDMVGTAMLIPILPVIFTDASSPAFILHGYSVTQQYFIAGLVTAIFGIMQFIAAPILGELSDMYGRKRLLTLGVATLAISQLIFGFGIEIGALWLLLISRAIAGLAGANFSIAQAAIADVTKPEDRAKNFGLIGAAFGIGFILGPVLSGWIAGVSGNPAAPFWLAGALGVINVVFISLMLPETRSVKKQEHGFHILKGIQNIRAAWHDKDAFPVYLSNFLYLSGFTFFTSFVGIMLVHRFAFSEADIGTFFGVVGTCIVVTQLFILRLITKTYHERQIVRVTIPMVALVLLGYAFVPSAHFVYFLIPLMSIPQGLTMANMSALVSKSVSPEKQGAALGINGSLMALAQGIIPLFAGIVSGVLGLTIPFVLGSMLMVWAWLNLFMRSARAAHR